MKSKQAPARAEALFAAAWRRGARSLRTTFGLARFPAFEIDGEEIPLVDFSTGLSEAEIWLTRDDVVDRMRAHLRSRRIISWVATVALDDCGFVADEKMLRAVALALYGRARALINRG